MSQKFPKSSKWPVYFLSAQGEFRPVALGSVRQPFLFTQQSFVDCSGAGSPPAEACSSVTARGLRPAQ